MYDKEQLTAGLEKLTGLDYIAAQKRFKATHKDFFGVIQLETEFIAEIAAAALATNVNELMALPLREYFGIITAVQTFLNSDSDTETTVAN